MRSAVGPSSAQSWVSLLFVSGGGLELSKCFTYIMRWDFDAGQHPRLLLPPEIEGCLPLDPFDEDADTWQGPIGLTYGDSDGTRQLLVTEPVYRGRRTLGNRIAPDGNWDDKFQHRLSQASTLATQLTGASILTGTANLAYRMMVCPKLEYPLGVTQFSPDQCAKIASKLLSVQLPRLGFNRHLPRAVVFGPISMGGLGLHDLYVEQGVRQISNLVGHLRQASETGRMMTIEHEWCQVQSGTGVNLLELPQRGDEYVDSCWIMSIQRFLVEHNRRIELTDTHHPQPLCDHDEFIMDTWRHKGLSRAIMKK